MTALNKSTKRRPAFVLDAIPPTVLLLPPIVVTLLLWVGASNNPEPLAVLFAGCLLTIPWGSYLIWSRYRHTKVPVFAMISGMYWIYFIPTLFFGARTILLVSRVAPVNEELVTTTVGMALLGIISVWCGLRLPWPFTSPDRLPFIPLDVRNLTYLRIVLVCGAFVPLFPNIYFILGGDWRMVMIDLTTVAPLAAFAMLLQRYWMGTSDYADRAVLLLFVSVRTAGSLASGWLGPMVSVGLVIVAVYIATRLKVPWRYIVLTILTVMFLQVGKTAYRSAFWTNESNATVMDRVTFWIDASTQQWGDALSGKAQQNSGQLAAQSVERASLLTQVSHVLEVTPSQVPYQMGDTYSYMAVTLIPRFLWPDKPSMSDANVFYALAYGLVDLRGSQVTSIAVGTMAEAFINFGWLGVAIVMFVVGMLLGLYEHVFFKSETNSYFMAIGLVLLPGLLAVESQLAQYLSGVVQELVATLILYLPIVRRTRTHWSAKSHVGVSHPAL